MMTTIEKLTALQAAANQAAWGIVEVETRERGWLASDADAARSRYEKTIADYVAAFGMEPEMRPDDAPGLRGQIPLAKPTEQRITALCGSEVV